MSETTTTRTEYTASRNHISSPSSLFPAVSATPPRCPLDISTSVPRANLFRRAIFYEATMSPHEHSVSCPCLVLNDVSNCPDPFVTIQLVMLVRLSELRVFPFENEGDFGSTSLFFYVLMERALSALSALFRRKGLLILKRATVNIYNSIYITEEPARPLFRSCKLLNIIDKKQIQIKKLTTE